MSHAMTHGTRSTSSSSFSSIPGLFPPRGLITSTTPCADPRKPQEGGSYPEQPPHTGYEPNRIVDNQIFNEQKNVTCTEDDQITEIEDHVKALSYNQSFLSSSQDSAESIGTPAECHVLVVKCLVYGIDKRKRNCLSSFCCLRSRLAPALFYGCLVLSKPVTVELFRKAFFKIFYEKKFENAPGCRDVQDQMVFRM